MVIHLLLQIIMYHKVNTKKSPFHLSPLASLEETTFTIGISFHCTSLYWALQVFCYLQIEGKIPHQQKDYDSQWSGMEPTISPRYACTSS